MEKKVITSILVWDAISIEIKYTPEWHNLLSKTDLVSHIELRSKERIPVTKTGYISIFFYQQRSTMLPSVDKIVAEYLDEAAQTKAWKTYRKERQQLVLF